MIGALITGGLSLLGGLFGRKDAKKQQAAAQRAQAEADAANRAAIEKANAENRALAEKLAATPAITRSWGTSDTATTTDNKSWVDTDAMMAAAEKAGFNPVTWLMAGGMGAYTQSSQNSRQFTRSEGENVSIGHNAAAAAQLASPQVYQQGAAPTMAIPSIGSIASNALMAGYGVYADDQRRQQEQVFQKDLIDHQLKGVAANNAAMQRSFYVPSTRTSGPAVVTADKLGQPTSLSAGQNLVTNPMLTRNVDPTVPDASGWAERWDELGGFVGGIAVGIDDLIYGVTGTTHDERGENRRKLVADPVKSGWINNGNYPSWLRAPTVRGAW